MARPISVGFTELLYGVVIGTAITGIDALALTRHNLLLGIALLLVFDDYFLYHEVVDTVEECGRNRVIIFWTDMMVLLAWYALSIAIEYKLEIYFLLVAVFFSSTSIWELIFAEVPFGQRLLWRADVPLVVVALALAGIYGRARGWEGSYITLFLVAFVAWRAPTYVELWRDRPRAGTRRGQKRAG